MKLKTRGDQRLADATEDMLAALQGIWTFIEDDQDELSEYDDPYSMAIRGVREAIAKATGEQ